MASPSSYISVVVTAFVTIFPFYGLVAKLTHLNNRSLEPCTDSNPCQWRQLFDASTKPRTYPITVQVRGNVTRPVMIATDWSAGTVALYSKPVPRAETLLLGVLEGGFVFEAPNTSNTSQLTTKYMMCLFFVCLDNEGRTSAPFLFGNMLNRSYEWVKNATDVWSSEVALYLQQHRETRQAVDDITAALKTCKLSVVGDFAWYLFVPLQNFYVGMYTYWAHKNPRPDLLPSPQCAQFIPEKMTEVCATDEQRKKVDNSLADQVSTKIFLASVVGWAATSAAHDVLLLKGYSEAVTIVVGAASVACQGLAVGAGFLAALGATEVFIAPLTRTNGEPCACYYKMDSTVALLLMSTPALLLYKYVGKKKRLLQSFVNGDYLYNVRFEVPFYIVRQNKGWPTHSLLLPTLIAPEATMAPEPRARFSTVGFYIASIAVSATTGLIGNVCCLFPVGIAGSSLFATAMTIMMEQTWRTHGIFSRVIAFLTTCPCLITVGIVILRLVDNWNSIGNAITNCHSSRFSRRAPETVDALNKALNKPSITGMLLQMTIPLLACPLICPWFIFTDKGLSPSEKLVIYNYWEAGGFFFVLSCLFVMNRFLGANWARSAFEACITPPADENFEAWQADRPEMVDVLQITTPGSLRTRLLEASSCPSSAEHN